MIYMGLLSATIGQKFRMEKIIEAVRLFCRFYWMAWRQGKTSP